MTDDLDFLSVPPPAGDPALRDRLRGRTAGVVRRRTWLHRFGRASVVLVAFAGGVAVQRFAVGPEVRELVVTVEVPAAVEAPAPPPVAVPERTPGELELLAEQADDPAEAARLFRSAGDRYLKDRDDLRAALRCYRNFLDAAGDADLSASPADTWLLASLKRDRDG